MATYAGDKNDLVLVMIVNDDLGGKIVKRSLTELGEWKIRYLV